MKSEQNIFQLLPIACTVYHLKTISYFYQNRGYLRNVPFWSTFAN